MEKLLRPDTARQGLPHLTLASRLERRRELLLRLFRGFDSRPAEGVDESAVVGAAPEVVERLAVLKATEVLHRIVRETGVPADGGLRVLGADTVIALGVGDDERILGKPEDDGHARWMIASLSGRSHRVYTGLAVCRPDREPETAICVTGVQFRSLSAAEIDAYVATGEPMDKAGAYAVQGAGARLIEGIEGCYYNVVGLPLSLTASLLAPLVRPDASLCDCASHPLQRGVARCSEEERRKGQGAEGQRGQGKRRKKKEAE